jgi:predicted permease
MSPTGNSSSNEDIMQVILSTFSASVRSVGTACTLAGVGMYLHQRGFVVGPGKRTLALISQQVTIPLLFFTKILYCNQDWSAEKCPNVTDSLEDVWILLLWPIYVCTAGLLVGYLCAKLARVPPHQVTSILVAVGFGNCTGLPITLLTVIHSNFPSNTNMGRIDPTLFLSVYLVSYPILQWGIGGWMLASNTTTTTTTPKKKKNDTNKEHPSLSEFPPVVSDEEPPATSIVRALRLSGQRVVESIVGQSHQHNSEKQHSWRAPNVLNQRMPTQYQLIHRGLDTLDASLYMSVQEHLDRYGKPMYGTADGDAVTSGHHTPTDQMMVGMPISEDNSPVPPPTTTQSSTDALQMIPPMSALFHHVESNNSIGMDLSNNTPKSGGPSNRMDHDIETSLPMSDDDAVLLGTMVEKEREAGSKPEPSNNTTSDTEQLFQAMKNDSQVLLQESRGRRHEEEPADGETTHLLLPSNNDDTHGTNNNDTASCKSESSSYEEEQLCHTVFKVVKRCLQPPVVGALLGLFVASWESLRGIFVDIVDRNGDAPMQWFFDGLYTTGQAAVPINMIILGCNLSASYMLNAKDHQDKFFSQQATMAVVLGKLVIMPIIGYVSVFVLHYLYPIPTEIAGSFYLVMLIVFLCPTANNVMVMVELSSGGGGGGGSKEGMARIIAYQYMVAPLVLSLTVTVSVLMATTMSDHGSMMPNATITASTVPSNSTLGRF